MIAARAGGRRRDPAHRPRGAARADRVRRRRGAGLPPRLPGAALPRGGGRGPLPHRAHRGGRHRGPVPLRPGAHRRRTVRAGGRLVRRLRGPPAPVPRHATLAAMLSAAARHPSGVTFVGLREDEVRLSWAEVDGRARRAAGALAARGIRPGDRVAIVLRTEPAFLDAFFGALHAGAVPVPLYPPVRLGRMDEYAEATARMLRVSGARALVTSGSVARVIGRAVAAAGPALDLGVVDAAGLAEGEETSIARGGVRPGARPVLLRLHGGPEAGGPHPRQPGRTGRGARRADRPDRRRRPRVLAAALPRHGPHRLPARARSSYPGPLVLIAPEHFLARPSLWLRALARHRGTISAAPHFAYAYAADRVRDAELAGLSLASWRIALDGAEPVTAGALHRFAARFSPFGLDPGSLMPVYGLSEASLAVTFCPRGGRRSPSGSTRPRSAPARCRRASGRWCRSAPPSPAWRWRSGARTTKRSPSGASAASTFAARRSCRATWATPPPRPGRSGTAGSTPATWASTPAGSSSCTAGRRTWSSSAAPTTHRRSSRPAWRASRGCGRAARWRSASCPRGATSRSCWCWPSGPGARGATGTALEQAVRDAVSSRTGVRPHTVRILEPGTLPRTSSGKMRRGEALRRFQAGKLLPPRKVNVLSLAREVLAGRLARARARR